MLYEYYYILIEGYQQIEDIPLYERFFIQVNMKKLLLIIEVNFLLLILIVNHMITRFNEFKNYVKVVV